MRDTVSVRPVYGPPLAWSTWGGGAFVLLSLDASITFRAANGQFVTPFRTASGRSMTRQDVGWFATQQAADYTIPSGVYRAISYNSGIELAVLDPPAGETAGVHVIGANTGLLPGSATPKG